MTFYKRHKDHIHFNSAYDLSRTSPKNSNKRNFSTNKQHKSNRNSHQEEDKASEEDLVREAWQKQRESEQLNVNPEEILEQEEKRTL